MAREDLKGTDFPLTYGEVVPYYHSRLRIPLERVESVGASPGSYAIPFEHRTYKEAHHTIRLRYGAVVDHEREYRESYQKVSLRFHDPEELTIQNEALYGFFTNACSFIESFCYMMFKLGVILNPGNPRFALRETKINPLRTWIAFAKSFPDDPVTGSIRSVLDSDEYKEISLFRNVLSHRAIPHRTIRTEDNTEYEYVQVDIEDSKKFVLTATSLQERLRWLTHQRDILIDDYALFIQKYFPSEVLLASVEVAPSS